MLFSQAEHSIIFEEGIMRNISVKVLWILTSDSDVVTDISYLEGCWHYYVAELHHLSNFGSEHYEKHICERILNLDLWFRSGWHLKAFLIYSSGQQNETICAVLNKTLLGTFLWINLNMDQWFRRRCSLKIFLIKSSELSRTICATLVEGIIKTILWNNLIWTGGSGDVVLKKLQRTDRWTDDAQQLGLHLRWS